MVIELYNPKPIFVLGGFNNLIMLTPQQLNRKERRSGRHEDN